MRPDAGSIASPPVALCLGGWDASGGAGLVRDLLTVAAFGLHPMAISTAETLQNGEGCQGVSAPLTSPVHHLQLLEPHRAGAVWGAKWGLVSLPEPWLRDLVAAFASMAPRARIWDPVRAPTVGAAVHDAQTYRRLAERVLGAGGWVVAPNRLEAACLAGVGPEAAPEAMARPWLDLGAEAVWLKGGHAEGDRVEDLWITPTETQGLGAHARLPGERRGTGCAVASAWLALRLLGQEPKCAAQGAAAWLRDRWNAGFRPGAIGRPVLPPGRP